jgi:hypothetical protein
MTPKVAAASATATTTTASQLARFRVNHARGRRRIGDRDDEGHASALKIGRAHV